MCAAQVVLTAYVIGCEVAFIYLFACIRVNTVCSAARIFAGVICWGEADFDVV